MWYIVKLQSCNTNIDDVDPNSPDDCILVFTILEGVGNIATEHIISM